MMNETNVLHIHLCALSDSSADAGKVWGSVWGKSRKLLPIDLENYA